MGVQCEVNDCDSQDATTRLMPDGQEANLCEDCLETAAQKLHREIEQWYQRETEQNQVTSDD